jgi:hypothetical protein
MQLTATANSRDAMPNFLTMDFTTVTVQVEETKFVAHKSLLTAVSPYFEKAFNGPFQEAEHQAITLEGISKGSFRIFLHRAYVHSPPFDTQSAALDHSALLSPNEANKLTASAGEDDAAAEENDSVDETASQAGSDRTVDPIKGNPVFDKGAFHTRSDDEYEVFDHERWVPNTKSFHLTPARLLILADQYSVPQLRDDILTALIGQGWKWNWWPDEDELASLIYSNLPASSRFAKFLAYSIAWVGIPHDERDTTQMMLALRELNPDLAFEVGMSYAVQVRNHEDFKMSIDISKRILNVCPFHDHTDLTETECRKRIASKPHVFTAILDACAKDVMTSSAENGEQCSI